jgi:hypothetical protein
MARRTSSGTTRVSRAGAPALNTDGAVVRPSSWSAGLMGLRIDGGPSREDIAARAYEIFVARGCEPGRHEEDWLLAEQELRARRSSEDKKP